MNEYDQDNVNRESTSDNNEPVFFQRREASSPVEGQGFVMKDGEPAAASGSEQQQSSSYYQQQNPASQNQWSDNPYRANQTSSGGAYQPDNTSGYSDSYYRSYQQQNQMPASGWQTPPQGTEIPVQPNATGAAGWRNPSPDRDGKKKKGGFLKAAGILLASVFGVGVVILAGIQLYTMLNPNQGNLTAAPQSSSSSEAASEPTEMLSGISLQDVPSAAPATPDENGEYSTEELAYMVSPSVVAITGYGANNTLQPIGFGSGIVFRSDGYIVTNAHVIEDCASLTVTMFRPDADGKMIAQEPVEGRVVATDAKTDLAVIRVDATDLPAATFGNSDQVRIGSRVIAIGNPQSQQFSGSVTQGIVSGLGRSITASSPGGGSSTNYENLIQTDAAINPGNSGGALVNAYGQVIGINSAKVISSTAEGLGFAIPANEAKQIVDDLINYKRVMGRVRLGITAIEVNELKAQQNKVPMGIYVVSTEENSSISRAGVLPGDIITEVDGESVTSFNSLNKLLKGKNPGDVVTLTIYRRSQSNPLDGKHLQATVELLEDTGEAAVPQQQQTPNQQQVPDVFNQHPQQPSEQFSIEDFLREYFGQ